MIKFAVEKRWSSEIAFEAEIECSEDTPRSWKLRLAVLWAIKTKADLSEANLSKANLSEANLSKANLSWANLSEANLSWANLSKADLSEANLSKANLSKANLSKANLSWANLSEANLSWANLSKANLSEANLSAIPEIKNIHQTVYAAASKDGALDMGKWHVCDTTHCRAGWVVTLAGAAGKALEFGLGTNAAAAFIYLKSDPKMKTIPNFYSRNEESLADMKSLAEQEAEIA